ADNTHTAKLTAGVLWDRRTGADNQPNPLMPVKGWLLAASVGWAFPSSVDNAFVNFFSSENHFVVISGQALGILPFKIRGAQFTLIGNLRYDEGIPINATALPVVERFFAGGDTTTRGYDPDQLKNEIVRSDVGPLADAQAFRVVPQGGNLRILNTVEIQFPIAKTFLGLPWPWVGSLFYDVGAVANAPNLLQGSDFKHAIGISLLRILTPVGPLSLEYAYPITQSLAEERWKTNPWYSHFPGRIHFNWGIPLTRL
ncbi:MAG TPA: BamA/TamA family outer membrane protein, partial [Kofleriaceae bacterium]|nr:BamA/TamA family outer membrane protein [Kofleriaceae bacterium]